MSRQDPQSTIVNRDALAADVASAGAALELAEIDLNNTRIVAPPPVSSDKYPCASAPTLAPVPT